MISFVQCHDAKGRSVRCFQLVARSSASTPLIPPIPLPRLALKLIRSYAVDAMESPTTVADSGLVTDAVRAFLEDVAVAGANRFKALGLGDDLRLNGLALAGAALEVSGQIVHLVSFPSSVYADHDEHRFPHTRMAGARVRRAFYWS